MTVGSPKTSDWMLTISIGLGLLSPFILPLVFAILITKKITTKIRWERHHSFLTAAIIWGVAAYFIENKSNVKALLPYLFYWSIPFLLMIKRIDERTIKLFSHFIFALLFLDITFNIIIQSQGVDPLGRTIDLRDGIFGKRLGGLFAHSFYSGSISICALTAALNYKKYRWIIALSALNLLLAGSWRVIIAGPIIALLLFGWDRRSKIKTALLIFLISTASILVTVATSNTANLVLKPNGANDLRIFAWTNAVQNIHNSPLVGNAFPNQENLEGRVNEEVISDKNIAESWYLSAASTFGLPYMILMAATLFSAVFRGSNLTSTPAAATLLPFLLIDLTYGEFIQGTLVYTWAWILILADYDKVNTKKF